MRCVLLAELVCLLVLTLARTAAAATSVSRAAVDEANMALAGEAPRRDVARAALERAVAAKDEPVAVGEAYFVLGELDEADFAYPQAMADDRAAIEAAPSTRWALRATDRLAWLKAHSEGDFAPLTRVEKVRRDPNVYSDPAAIASLAHDLEAFPPGPVRVEGRMLVAEAWLGRLGRPGEAIGELQQVATDPTADPLTQRLAERELVDALVATGDIDRAAAEATDHSARLDPRFVKQVKRLLLRRTVRRAAWVVLAAFALFAGVGLARAAQRRMLGVAWRELRKLAPVAALFVAFVAIAGGVLASKYETGNASPFLMLGAAVLPLVLVARAWSAVGAQTGAARAGRGVLCGATVVAATFTLLDLFGPQYLPGFGL